MKKYAIQIVTLVLCLVLLTVTVIQANKIEELEQQMNSRVDDLRDSLYQEVSKVSANLERKLEEANSLISAFALEPSGIDTETGYLLADACLKLKQWQDDMEVVVYAQVEEKAYTVTMESDQPGQFRGLLQLPLVTGTPVSLEARISMDGVTRMESLGSWGDISMLLPLRAGGSGWSGPNYVQGAMTTRFHIAIGSTDGSKVNVVDPVFTVYKNGILVDTVDAVIDPESFSSNEVCYTTDTEGNFYSIDCDPQDIMEIRFCCQDQYGLGYDFLFMIWSPEHNLPEPMTKEGLVLSWNKQ